MYVFRAVALVPLLLFAARDVNAQRTAGALSFEVDAASLQELKTPDANAALGALLAAYARSTALATWERVVVEDGQTWYGVVNERYRFYDSEYREVSDELRAVIADRNGIDSEVLRAGDTLLLPELPVRPSRDAQARLTQMARGGEQEVFLAEGAYGLPLVYGPTAPREWGSTWSLTIDQPLFLFAELASASEGVMALLRSSILIGGDGATVPIEVPSGATSDTVKAEPRQQITPQQRLSGVTYNRDFVVFDVFGSAHDCSHGDRVLDVVHQVLRDAGAAHLAGQVKPYEFDFYRDPGAAEKIVEAYLKDLTPNARARGYDILKRLKKAGRPSGGGLVVPVIYLAALYHQAVMSGRAAVVSSSVWTRYDGWSLLPALYTPHSETLLVAAVLDQEGSLIEQTGFAIEPLNTFYNLRRDLGAILVGAELESGIHYGMSSTNGDVTTLAPGMGYEGQCIQPRELGTSYSTPAIATMLFVAKAWWNSAGVTPSASEVKERLSLASEVDPDYAQRFATAGIPRLERLLSSPHPYAIRVNDQLDLVAIESSHIEVAEGGGTLVGHFGKCQGCFRGLFATETSVLLLRHGSHKWSIEPVSHLDITLSVDGVRRHFPSLDSLRTVYKEVSLP